MSQNGASRWARGTMGYAGNLGGWSVAWDNVAQILTHYYTGIHLRNTNTTATTPDYRWNPLQLIWSVAGKPDPPVACADKPTAIKAVIQNTGVTSWPNDGSIAFGYAAPVGSAPPSAVPPQLITPGDFYTATVIYQPPANLPDGSLVTLTFDMYRRMGVNLFIPFSQLDASKPWYSYNQQIKVVSCPPRAFLPALRTDAIVQ